MDANLNFLTAPTANTSSVGVSVGSNSVDPSLAKPMNGKEFAGLMRDLMPQSERQDIAGEASQTVTDLVASGLQTLNLGNQLAVITTANPLPDTNSLAQFARSQGLSETAVQALFGDLEVSAIEHAGLHGLNNQSTANLTTGLLSSATTSAWTTDIKSVATDASEAPTVTMLPSLATLNWLQAHPGSEVISDKVEASLWSQAPHQNPLTHLFSSPEIKESLNFAIPATSVSPITAKLSDVNTVLQAAGATGILQSMNGLINPSNGSLTALQSTAETNTEMGPLDVMRLRMVPAWESTTRQLSQMSGTEQAAAWGQLTANLFASKSKGDESKEVILNLGADDPELMATLDSLQDNQSNANVLNNDAARHIASTGSLGAAATSAAIANPSMTDRAAQIQDMADKLGKAMAERLQDQLEKGEWKLQLKLNPAHLGKIDVELDMNASGLDAVFKTDNLLTRELIAQGMPKLKDSLSQSGMTVANVWVNSENQRGSGGNSTPRQNNGPDNSVSATVTEVAATETRIRDLRSNDAWDTLA
jgi:flagellar hook-length control protein FliK